ncbi:MAG TPA: DUF3488 domain-containing protein [Anaerolineae bacterium]|nr:DUF3488 domain-containing protein [Anaerolineae bacterium]
MITLLKWLWRQSTPREGWFSFLLALLLSLVPAVALRDAHWVGGMGILVWLALSAALLAMTFSRLPVTGLIGTLLMMPIGVEATVLTMARARPPLWPLLQECVYAVSWLRGLPTGSVGQLPFLSLAQLSWSRLQIFATRFSWWVNGVMTGGASQDDLIFLFFLALLVWGTATWAGWWSVRRKPLRASLPVGMVVATNAFFAGEGYGWVLSLLGLMVMLSWTQNWTELELDWLQRHVDYSPELYLEYAMAGILLTSVIVGAAVIVPVITSRKTVDWFWRTFSHPWHQVEETGQRLFPALERKPRSPVGSSGVPGLPRSHLLGGAPDLSQRIALRVRINEPPPPMPEPGYSEPPPHRYYWRGITYDTYTGRGWENQELDIRRFDGGTPWVDASLLSARRELLQQVELVQPSQRLLYAAAEPLAPDHPYRVRLRGPGDLVSMEASGRVDRYTILSAVSTASEADLRAAGNDYPPEVLDRYLQLPELPERVHALAAEIVSDAATSYDQALALQDYLRQFPYTLQVDVPPPDIDVVDYFLFQLQKGYCDYYATAMVVLARAVGLPARLAVGYAMGDYEYQASVYVVTEADAHSWPEVYFPGYGWQPFEPTAARAVFARESEAVEQAAAPSALSQRLEELKTPSYARSTWAAWVGFGLLVLAVGAGAWLALRPSRQATELEIAARLYGQLLRWGRWLGRPATPYETPREYSAALSQHLHTLTTSGWRQRLAPMRLEVETVAVQVALAFERARYGRGRDRRQLQGLTTAWADTERARWLLWLARRGTSNHPPLSDSS